MNTEADFTMAPDWRGRSWALARVVLFIAAFVGLNIGINIGLHAIIPPDAPKGTGIFVATIVLTLMTILLTFVMAKISGRPFGAYGLGGSRRLRNFIIGSIAGIALLAALLFLQSTLGVYAFGVISGDPATLAEYGALYVVLFLAVATNEELLFRGYVLVELSRVMSFWPAAILLAALFGFAHYANEGPQGVVGGAQAGLFALVASYAFLKTRSLWLSIGLHFGWDYAESYIFGVGNSGNAAVNSLLNGSPHGPDMLTGGTVGPEGTPLASIFVLAMLIFAFALRTPRDRASA